MHDFIVNLLRKSDDVSESIIVTAPDHETAMAVASAHHPECRATSSHLYGCGMWLINPEKHEHLYA
jgi:hypothetical protein